MMIVRYRFCGMKSVYASGLTRQEALKRLKSIQQMWLDRGCDAERTSWACVEVTNCSSALEEGEYRLRPDNWPLVNGEPV